ncbi:MAG: hypothetical protein ACT4RN_20260 [Pseudonocardia sp.]
MSRYERGPHGRYVMPWGRELDEAGQRLYELRESGYTGWADQDGYAAACPLCEDFSCTRDGFAGSCNGSGS